LGDTNRLPETTPRSGAGGGGLTTTQGEDYVTAGLSGKRNRTLVGEKKDTVACRLRQVGKKRTLRAKNSKKNPPLPL